MSNLKRVAFVAGFLPLLLIAAPYAYAQSMPNEVSGTYVNAESGVEITFPDPFTGFEISGPFGTLVTTSPGGLSEPDPELMTSITLVISEKSNQDPSDPSSFTNQEMDCNPPSIRSITVAGVQGSEVTSDCPSTSQKFRMVAVQTETSWVVVMYMSPASEFESNVGAFNSAVGSLNVQGAMDVEGTGPGGNVGLEIRSMTRSISVANEMIEVNVKTSSTITNFALDEQSKRVSFTVDGPTGTAGTTEISIGRVLEGPYTVAIDGQITNNFQVGTDAASGETVITVTYTHSVHEVTITGTNVVPEFPAVAIAAITAVVGVVAVLGRTRLLRGGI